MTNILKDIWEDRERGACWLPRDIFEAAGFDLRELAPGKNQKEFAQALRRLVGITHDHLRRALDYTMLIPRQEKGIRNFCLWAIGMAMLTLREINRRPNFSRGDEVKISRRSVRATIAASRLGARSDLLLKAMFRAVGRSLPIEHAGSKPG